MSKLITVLKPMASLMTGISGFNANDNSEGGVWGFMQRPQQRHNQE
jgi:hypothetical protein